MNKKDFLACVRTLDFTRIFIESGWNRPLSVEHFSISVNGTLFEISEVAQRGLRVFVAMVDQMPVTAMRRVLDSKLRKYSQHYLIVYVEKVNPIHQLWSVPVNSVDKRELITIEYASEDQALFLLEKINMLTFGFDEEPCILDVVERVSGAFLINAENVTKKFYKGFKDQRKALLNAIRGVDSDSDRDWYASIMLNRLMFCYFLQKKGFLDSNESYLRDKLEMCKRKGNDLFYGKFYRRFLRVLFQEGLNCQQRSVSFKKNYGRIPYLNGGMFEEHTLEKRYKDLDIPDSYFEKLFDFFDQWHWHLDSRITASGKDINPDVLGFIFEQYINDRAELGAYYTKEDITGYISRNAIIACVLNKLKSRHPAILLPGGFARELLVKSGDRYIRPAMLKGVDDVRLHNDALKAEQNKFVGSDKVLPTELWREYLLRCRRVEWLRESISEGKISSSMDCIRENVDIRLFVEDLIKQCPDRQVVSDIYDILRNLKVLDPACGSGAFLFAALNVLESLYEACLDRFEDDKGAPEFEAALSEMKGRYKTNRKYFVYKNVILRNLYGVDILREAIEIARLRLFLKMVSVVDVDPADVNLGLDPLPDIEFNVCCGNSLVGYLSKDDVGSDIRRCDLFADSDVLPRVEEQVKRIAADQIKFRKLQLAVGDNSNALWDQKVILRERIEKAVDTLNEGLYRGAVGKKYSEWLVSVKPFHWYAVFHAVIHDNGGFDVVVGNPPYVKNSVIERRYSLAQYVTRDSGNVYTAFIERATGLCNATGIVSYIVQLPLVCIDAMKSSQQYIKLNFSDVLFATFDDRPGKLFDQLEHIRATIFFASRQGAGLVATTDFNRWPTELRGQLFDLISYYQTPAMEYPGAIPKVGSSVECGLLLKLLSKADRFDSRMGNGKYKAYYHNAPLYWIRATKKIPYFKNDRGDKTSSQIKTCQLSTEQDLELMLGILNSSLFYFWFIVFSDTRHLNVREIERFPVAEITEDQLSRLRHVTDALMVDYERNKERKTTTYEATGTVVYDEYHPGCSKAYIDAVDDVLAEIYGLNPEELDFVKNFNFKFRMGQYLKKDN